MHWGHNIYQGNFIKAFVSLIIELKFLLIIEIGSEHFIDEDKYPLELHLVHRSNSNKIAVLGFIFQVLF